MVKQKYTNFELIMNIDKKEDKQHSGKNEKKQHKSDVIFITACFN